MYLTTPCLDRVPVIIHSLASVGRELYIWHHRYMGCTVGTWAIGACIGAMPDRAPAPCTYAHVTIARQCGWPVILTGGVRPPRGWRYPVHDGDKNSAILSHCTVPLAVNWLEFVLETRGSKQCKPIWEVSTPSRCTWGTVALYSQNGLGISHCTRPVQLRFKPSSWDY
jgi:hypothetical protein